MGTMAMHLAYAQGQPATGGSSSGSSSPSSVAQAAPTDMRPGASIVIREDPTGSELVDITMLSPRYPEDLLRAQVERIGQETGVASRGVMVFAQTFGTGPDQKFVKARFATNNLIDRPTGQLNLQAIARAFAGAPAPHTVRVLQVMFDGETPNTKTLKSFANDGVAVDGKVSTTPPGLEYTVLLRTQDAAKITIPSEHTPPPPTSTEPARPQPALPLNLLIALIVLASAAAGALVYFVMLGRSGSRSASSPRKR